MTSNVIESRTSCESRRVVVTLIMCRQCLEPGLEGLAGLAEVFIQLGMGLEALHILESLILGRGSVEWTGPIDLM